MDLIGDLLKNEVNQAMTNVFDSFARTEPVVFYKTSTAEVTAYDPNFNGGFQQIDSLDTVTSETVSQSFICRVIYLDRQDYNTFIEGGEDVGVNGKTDYNRIKLQCKEDAFNYLRDTERFVFLGEKYAVEETWKRIGVLGAFQHYQITLRRVA
jgi:hypothetical protein